MLNAGVLQKHIQAASNGDGASLSAALNASIVPTGCGTLDTTAATLAATQVKEYGFADVIHKTVITCTAVPVTFTVNGTTDLHGGVKLYDFPEGLIATIGGVVNGSVTIPTGESGANWTTREVGLGSATAGTGTDLTSTEDDIVASAVISTAAVADVGTASMVSTAMTVYDGTATALDLYLNFSLTYSATMVSGAGSFTGTITLTWMNLGDK